MRSLALVVFSAGLAGLLSVELAALLIAVLSLTMSAYAVVVARASRLSRATELERQSEAVAAVKKARDEVDAQLRDPDGE